VTAPAAAHARAGAPGTQSNRGLFYALLIAATLLPYLLFPICLYLLPRSPASMPALQTFLFLGAGGHVAASFFFYEDPEVRSFMRDGRWVRYTAAPIILLIAAGAAFSLGPPTLRAHATLAFWIWQVHHFTRQNHGILAFASRADGVAVSTVERTAITLTDLGAVLATICLVTPLRATVLADWGWQIYATAAGCYAAAWIFFAAGRPLQHLAAAPLRTLIYFLLMLFYLPLFLFDDPFPAVYMYRVAHGLQYLVFMGFVAGRPRASLARRLGTLTVFTLAGGALIRMMQTPDLWGSWRETAMGLSLGIIMWHFVLDAGVWRLSEPFQRGFMAERFDFLRSGPRRPATGAGR
jgi:hypothetical protein